MTSRRFSPTPLGDRGFSTRRLQAVDFAISDTVLYLDAYPDDKEAIAYYHSLLKTRGDLLAACPQDAPLTIYDNTSPTWDWVKAPWPWENEAN